ncbi:RHOMBOID-like protein [Psidium guajava]|nr:RHOMBOID-like protein [Psidium guajava]
MASREHHPSTSSSSEIKARVSSWRGNNAIHPVDIDIDAGTAVPAPSPVVCREVKHFKKWKPLLVPCFILANTVVFVITMYVNNCPQNSVSCLAKFLGRFSFQPLKENPLLGPSSSTLQKMGALEVSRVVDRHQVWLLITCIWLHGGVFHLLANMLSFLVIGIRLEQEFGFVLIGSLYVISGLGGSLMSSLFIQSSISVGASGALFGLLGGMLSELITNWSIYANKVASISTLLVITVINLAVGVLPHVDNFAHMGGFLAGFLLGFVLLIRPQYSWIAQKYTPPGYASTPAKPKFKTYQCALWVISLTALIVGFILGMVMLLRGVNANDYCSWCHYMSCVPTSRWSCKAEPASCSSDQIGSQLNLTCSSNGKSRTYTLPGATASQIQGLCTQLCN